MKLWADFHSLVLPSVLGCPIPTMDNALRLTARDFCRRTRAWVESESFTAPGVINQFDFDIPMGTELVRILSVDIGGDELPVYGHGALPKDWATRTPSDGLYHFDLESYLLFPVPAAGALINVEAAVMPGNAGTGVGDDVFNRYSEDIAAGALARLMKLPRQEWTDLGLSADQSAQYERAVHAAANRDFIQTAPAQRRVKKWG